MVMDKYKILWIEDDADLIWGLMEPIIYEGHKVVRALDRKRAKELLEKEKFDLIVLDIILPSGEKIKSITDLDHIEKYVGLNFLKSLPSDSPPILVLSVVNNEEIISQIENFPQVRKYLQKGFVEPDQLKDEIMKILIKETH